MAVWPTFHPWILLMNRTHRNHRARAPRMFGCRILPLSPFVEFAAKCGDVGVTCVLVPPEPRNFGLRFRNDAESNGCRSSAPGPLTILDEHTSTLQFEARLLHPGFALNSQFRRRKSTRVDTTEHTSPPRKFRWPSINTTTNRTILCEQEAQLTHLRPL